MYIDIGNAASEDWKIYEIWNMSPSDMHKVNVAWNLTVSEKFLMRVGEIVQTRFYITAIPCLHLY